MATTGLSEWSTGLQLIGFRGASDLQMVEGPTPAGVQKFVRVTALKARVTGVVREDHKILVHVRPEAKGYEVVAVDVSDYNPGDRLAFVFVDPSGTAVAHGDVLIE